MPWWWPELTAQVLSTGFAAGVLGNLAASALLGLPALWHLHRKLDRQHRAHLEAIRGAGGGAPCPVCTAAGGSGTSTPPSGPAAS